MGSATPAPDHSANTTTPSTPQQARFQRFWRENGGPPRRSRFCSAAELTAWCDRDLDILIAPLDGKYADSEEEYETLVNLYHIPDQFVLERKKSVTHSLGRQLGEDGSETLWMHFLCELPSTDPLNRQPTWLKWAFILTWRPVTPGSTKHSVSLIAFQPPIETWQRLVRLWQSSNWTDVMVDPYILVDMALASWYERVDDVAWEVNNMVRTDEEDIFRRTQTLRSSKTTISDLNLHRIHTSAKYTIFMVEALDAIIRSADLALLGHDEFQVAGSRKVWENTNRRLRHTLELFHSTRLRTASAQARIKNTVDLTFHINTMHDSQVNLDNSRSVRIISIVGMVFIPFSAVSSIFGTQFFSTADTSEESGRAAGRHMDINPDFWMLWAIAMPLTLIIIGIWRRSEYKNSGRSDGGYLSRVSSSLAWLRRPKRGSGSDAGEPKDDGTIV